MQKSQLEAYEEFIQWFTKSNGKIHEHIKFPSYIEPLRYIGIAATNDISKGDVLIAVPRKMIIGVKTVLESQLSSIIKQYEILNEPESDDTDFNLLTLFLIHEKMKDQKSYYYPYLSTLVETTTLIDWSDDEIYELGDPFLNIDFIKQIRTQFQPVFKTFVQICESNPKLFPQKLTLNLFTQSYRQVMTRVFGWGLPETMIVPFADYFNHSSNGVHHYVLNTSFEDGKRSNLEYIMKRKDILLETFGINNSKQVPIGYQMNQREKYYNQNRELLKGKGIQFQDKDPTKLPEEYLNSILDKIRSENVLKSYKNNLYLSSDSEDNDSAQSEDQQQKNQSYKKYFQQKRCFIELENKVNNKCQQKFDRPQPQINREFNEGVNFDWWYQQEGSYFIVAAHKNIKKGEEIFNSYGRRNNRFLALWYGFTFQKNKYDSVPFRFWGIEVQKSTGNLVYSKFITEKEWKESIPIGNQRYPLFNLSFEFRLKKIELNYILIAYLRFRVIKSLPKYAFFRNKYKISSVAEILQLEMEIQSFEIYQKALQILKQNFKVEQKISILSKEKLYFSNILKQSNKQIITANQIGVSICIKVLKKLVKQQTLNHEKILQVYNEYYEQDKESSTIKAQNRILIREYFKFLQEFINGPHYKNKITK